MGRKSPNWAGHASFSMSQGGATRNAPSTQSVFFAAVAAQCPTARQPKLCATRNTGDSTRLKCASICAIQSSRDGRVQLCCTTRRKRVYLCSHRVCQCPAPDPFQPGITSTEASASDVSNEAALSSCTCIACSLINGRAEQSAQPEHPEPRPAAVCAICGSPDADEHGPDPPTFNGGFAVWLWRGSPVRAPRFPVRTPESIAGVRFPIGRGEARSPRGG